MADVSLDEYIVKKRRNFHRPNGPNQAPFITNPKMRPQTIVRTFDARNKLGGRTNVMVQDARQKLVQKTKFVDARVRIENKAAMKTPNRFNDARLKLQQKKVIQNPQNADACFKIQITQSSKFDARAKIVAKKGPSIQVSSTTNAGGASVFQAGGNLLKVVRTNQVAGNTPNIGVMNQIGVSGGLIRTIQNQGVVQGDLQQQQQWQQQQQQQQQQQWLQKQQQQQQQWQQQQTWQQQQWQQQQQVTRGRVLMSGDNIHVISANTQMNSAGRPTQVNMARTFRQTTFRPQPVQQLLSSNSNVAMTRSISNDIYQQPVAVHPQSAGYNPTAQCVRQPPFQAWSDSPMDTPQYAEETVADYDEELVDVVYEEEVLEDESPADQWSADTDPYYMAPVSPQMTIQAPVRQREAAPLPSADVISPIQGFRIIISNLQPIVSQDDIIELFGAIGPLKRARLLKAGIAEVVFVDRQDALTATQRYHLRELDGQPMHVKMSSEVGVGRRKQATGVGYSTPRVAQRLSAPVHQRSTIQHITAPMAKRIQPPLAQQARQQRVTPRRVAPQRITPPGKIRLPVGARIKAPVSQKIKLSGMPRTKVVGERIKPPVGLSGQPAVSSRLKPAPIVTSSSAPLRLARPSNAPVDRKPVLATNTVDQGLVHRALFKTLSKDDPPSRPVKFTVKI